MKKYAGIAMLFGAILFSVGAFNPAVRGVFEATSEAEALAVLESQRAAWNKGNLLFGLGGLVSAAAGCPS